MAFANHFLATLEADDLDAIAGALEPVAVVRNQLIVEAGRPLTHAYLPLAAILSIITVMRGGGQVESRTIGRESGFGLLHALGARTSFERVICQVGGECLRLPVRALAAAAADRPGLTRAIVCHAQATLIQTAQATACNTLHAAMPRMARWLLMTQDRLDSPVLPLTQEHVAIMLGVQRTTVTAVAQELQERGLIAYSRGRITVLDRPGLRDAACECYLAMEEGVQAVFGELARPPSPVP